MSKQYEIILDVIQNGHGHMTGDQVYVLAKEKLPNISLGTVYRNLGRMAEEGVIRRFTSANGPDIFDKTVVPHGHMVCAKCGKVSDIEIRDINELLNKDGGVEILSYELIVNYLCDKCRDK